MLERWKSEKHYEHRALAADVSVLRASLFPSCMLQIALIRWQSSGFCHCALEEVSLSVTIFFWEAAKSSLTRFITVVVFIYRLTLTIRCVGDLLSLLIIKCLLSEIRNVDMAKCRASDAPVSSATGAIFLGIIRDHTATRSALISGPFRYFSCGFSKLWR